VFALAVVVLILIIAAAYAKGVRGGQAWGKKALAVAVIGLVVVILFHSLAFPVLAVVFGGCVLMAYLQGVKKGAPWGKPAVVAGCIALLALLFCRVSCKSAGHKWTIHDDTRVAMARAEAVGRGLRPHLRPGSRLLILGDIPEGSDVILPASLDGWKAGLSKGLGDETWVMVGYRSFAEGESFITERMLHQALAEAEGGVDAVVCFAAVAENLAEFKLYQEGKTRPKMAVFCVEPSADDLGRLKSWLKKGVIDVVVVESDGNVELCKPGE
jgi:uncharacterized membrane protein